MNQSKVAGQRVTDPTGGSLRNRAGLLQSANAALKEEIARRREATAKLSAFANLGRRLNSATGRLEAARIIVETADKLLGWDACYLVLYREADDRIVPILGMDIVGGRRCDISSALREEHPGMLARRVLREGGELVLRTARSRAPNLLTPFGNQASRAQSLLLVPIRHGETSVGILSIQSYDSEAYDRDALDSLQALADHCGGALHRISAEEAMERTTRELLEKDRKILDAQKVAHLGSWEWDLATDKMVLSDEMFRILGFAPQEFEPTYRTSFARIHPDDQKMVRRMLDQSLKSRDALLVNCRIVRPDSSIRVIQARGEVISDRAGKPSRMAGTAQDMTELERVMGALRESEQRFRAVFVRAAVGIAITDAKGVFLETNAAYRQITGYSGEELRARDFLSITHPEDARANRKMTRLMFAGKIPGFNIEKRYLKKDGGIVWVQNSVSLVRDANGCPSETIALAQDITERKKAERLVLGQNRLVELVARGTALREVLDAIVRFVEEHATGMLGSVLLFDPDTRSLRHGSAPSLPAAYTRAVDGLEIGPSVGSCGTAAFHHKHVIASDISTDPLWQGWWEVADRHNLRACWSSPILSNHGELLGTFALYYHEPRKPKEEERQLIQIATYVTSMAIERQRSDQVLRDFHQRVVEAQETERRRVSRELHDSVSQLLASIRFRIQSAIEIPAVDLNERHGEKLQLKLLVDHAMREVRRISRNLRPSELDDLGLESAIGNLAREFDQRMRIELAIHLSNLPKRFPPEIELALYRIIQESLRNVELHSGATRAEVRLTRTRNSVLLKIKDNGHGGIDTSARSKRRAESGIGLANIRERAAMVGGTFTIESNHLTGTEIAVRIPLEALGKSAKD